MQNSQFFLYKISSLIFCFICSGILQGVNEKNWTTFIHAPCLHIALAPINYRRIVFLFWDTCQIFQISKKYDKHFTRAWVKWNNPRALWNSILVNCDFTVGWSISGIAKNLMANRYILFAHLSVFFYLISSSFGLGDLFTFRFAFDSFLLPSPSSGWSPSASPFWFIPPSSRWGESGGKGGGKSKGSSS